MEDNLLIEDSEIEKLLEEIDINKDGKIDFQEFKKMMEVTQTIAAKK